MQIIVCLLLRLIAYTGTRVVYTRYIISSIALVQWMFFALEQLLFPIQQPLHVLRVFG